ncbi:MAG TPA: iron ABC transporter permease [Desulfobacteraceae bacterium]|nr:iron ABC transporter permease [Desulfobacteraceae bacterium]
MKDFKILIMVLSPFLFGFIALFLGAYGINAKDVIKILLNETLHVFHIEDTPQKAIVLDIRLPRIILAGLVGAALSGSGVTLQGIFRNPLIDPFILGISAGAAFGCAICVGFLNFIPIQLMAFIFSLLAVIISYNIAKGQGEVSRLPLILSGVIVSAFFTALVSIIKFLVDPHRLQAIVFWLMGSFSLSDWDSVKIAGVGIGLSLIPIFFMRWRLNVLSLGYEEAKALGINVKLERLLFIGFSTLAVSVATSLTGIIGWVGLMVPHLVRMIIGPDHRILVPLSFFAGGSFMIAADTISRTLTSFDIPVGIITSISGAPFFIYLLKRGGKEVWGR